MKKKLLAGFLSLLMIITMASGVLGALAPVFPGTTYPTVSPDCSTGITQTMLDSCPECKYAYAFFYVHGDNIKYACPKCKATGYSYMAYTPCLCRKDCSCIVACVCGKLVNCGTTCGGCNRFVLCSDPCKTCEKPVYSPLCAVCKTENCDCVVSCTFCGKAGECGDFCTRCGTHLECKENCTTCKTDAVNPTPGACHLYCDCRLVCTNCNKVTGICGTYCKSCGVYISCPKNCTTCVDHVGKDYKVFVSTGVGGSYHLTNGAYGTKGETKILTITPYANYKIYNVSINGVSYGSLYSTFELKMDRNYIISISYRLFDVNTMYTVTATATGKGDIVLQKNNVMLNSDSVQANYNDVLSYHFVAEKNYIIKDVKVNGISIGAVYSYSIENLRANTTITVEFAWDSPYTDVAEEHLPAVEFVTEAGIMSSYYKYISKHKFIGENILSLKSVVAMLAELSDDEDILTKDADRVQWMIDNGVITEETNLKCLANVQNVSEIVAKYLEMLEKKGGITFLGDKSTYTAKETCIALELFTEKEFKDNAKFSRYDMAELCYAIANLEYAD